jgi:phenylalanyl-tRNA synthetase beta chain
MKVSIRWMEEILGAELDPARTAEKLTMAGTEVEEIARATAPGSGVVVAEVIETAAHPDSARSGLKVVQVWNGREQVQVVCGAPNTPGKGARVVYAGPGTDIKGLRIEGRDFDGVASAGMLCSEDELDIGPDEAGIIVLEEDVKAGTPLSEAFRLEDWILDLSITPNRPDLLGHIGTAREAAALLKMPFACPAGKEGWRELDEDTSSRVRVVIEDAGGCPRYAAAVVAGVSVGRSPLGMRSRLHRLGVRPISNAVDVTNWILLLHNQPLHAFDLKRVSGASIIVRRAAEGERIITLDGVERRLEKEDLVIADASSPVAMAGIMGGEGSGIDEWTKDVLIECAYFDPVTIRRTSSRLNLSSESSYRFERGIDPTNQMRALRDSVAMMCGLTGGSAARGLLDVHPAPHRAAAVRLRRTRVDKILGVQLDWKASLGILERLGGGVEEKGKDRQEAHVVIPAFRPDLTREIDLIEEIARVTGFDNIPSKKPVITADAPERSSYDLVQSVRHAMAAAGFTEAVNISIVAGEKQERYFPGRRRVEVANPLSSEKDTMRLSLIPGLLDNLVYATTWKEPSCRMFEVGTVFSPGEGGLVDGIVEKTAAAAVAFGPRPAWVGERRGEADFYDVLGLLMHLGDGVWHVAPEIVRDPARAPAFLTPVSACRIMLGGRDSGWMGELHPGFYEWLELPRTKGGGEKVGVMEITLPDLAPARRKFSPISSFPTAERDIAMIFDETVETAGAVRTIRETAGPILESVRLFDIYRGKGPDWTGKKSLAFSLVYRSRQATLRAEEIDELHGKVVSALEAKLGGKLR